MSDQKPKSTTGTIIRHGEAPYQHDPNNSNNYFVEVEVEKDKFETLWGVQLKELVESQQLEVGEKVSFHKFKQETGANRWEAERYFEVEKFENSIERDFEQDKVQEKLAEAASEFEQSKVKQAADYGTDDAEYILPNSIRNRYLSVAVNKHTDAPMVKFYERENPASVAFEDRGDKGLHTSKSDKDTITAMLDMAQSKGWESIKLKGSEEFKREAWMEAQMRGIKTKGYEPTEKDKLELQARQEERTSNQIEATKIGAVYTKEADKTGLDHAKDAGIAVGTSAAMGDNLTAATAVQAIVTDKVQSLAADVVIDQHEQTTETEIQQEQSTEVVVEPAPTTEQETSSSLSWAIDDLKKVVGEEETTKILNEIDNDLAAIQPDHEQANQDMSYAKGEIKRLLGQAEEFDAKIENFDEYLAKKNLESTPESRLNDGLDRFTTRYKIDAVIHARRLAEGRDGSNYYKDMKDVAVVIASLKAQQEMSGVTAHDVSDYMGYVEGEVIDAEARKMQEDYEQGLIEYHYTYEEELLEDFDTDEYRITQAEGRDEMDLAIFEARYEAEQAKQQATVQAQIAELMSEFGQLVDEDVPPDAATEADVQRHNENFEKMLHESQVADQSTKAIQPSMQLAEEQFKSYFGEEKATEFLSIIDRDIDDNLLFEQYLEDLENGEIRSDTLWDDYRDDWHEAFAEVDREAEIQAAEQQHDLKEVETEAYVRAEEFQRGRDIDPDLDMNVAGEAERFKTDVVAAPKVAGMTQAKVTQKVEAAFDRKIDGSMAAVKREDFKKDFEENKAKLRGNDKVKVEAVRRILDYLHKDNPKELQAGYEKLNTAMKNGEISKLPDVPQQVVQQSIEIQAPTQSNKDRGR